MALIFTKMLERYIKLNSGIGISLQLIDENSCAIEACKVVSKHNSLEFEKKITGLKSPEDLTYHFPEKSVMALNLTGKGILHKQIEKVTRLTPAQFSQLFPGANFNDFYVQNFVSGPKSFVSIIRKTEADKWLRRFQRLGFEVVMLSLGPFPIEMILPQLNAYNESLVFNGHTVIRNRDLTWESYSYNQLSRAPYPFKVENEQIEEQLLIAYAAAFQLLFAHYAEVVEANIPALNTAFSRVISRQKMRVFGFSILLIFFVLLLANFLIFWRLDSSNKKLGRKVISSEYGYQEYLELETAINFKEAQLKNLGWDGGLNKAFLIDQLAEKLPQEITWYEISINPLNKTAGSVEGISLFVERSISVKGYSKRIVPVNNWIMDIKEKPWVTNVQLEHYVYNPEAETGEFVVVVKF